MFSKQPFEYAVFTTLALTQR